ncbi:MAG: fibronectin type III domain-containing protein [Eubacterium sp.]|nr:fibronectin type III domain-containing protein [Eubacterium sp.]
MILNRTLCRKALSAFLAVMMIISTFLFTGIMAIAEENGEIENTLLPTPMITSLVNTEYGIEIGWKEVEGAEKYRVFYRIDGDDWVIAGDTEETSYTWTDVKSSIEYIFTVCCINEDGSDNTSEYDSEGLSITYISVPKLISVSNSATGAKISWQKVEGAEKYRVFYKTGDDVWHKVGDTEDTSFIWTKAKSGTKYVFTVRCTTADGAHYTSAYDPTGLSLDYVAAPKISLAATADSIQINWNAVKGASKYRVFYLNKSGGWTRLAVTSSTSYTYKKVQPGEKYTFTVRCLDKDGETYISSYDPKGQTVTYVEAPKLKSVSNGSKGVNISWGKVKNAEKYRVFYKTGNGKWTKIADTTSTSYTWKEAKSGTNYTFTVRCVNSDGGSYASPYISKGMSLKYIAAPKLSSALSTASGVKITWGKVSGAAKYRVFYKIGNGKWVRLADTASTSYTWKEAKKDTKYVFTVRCISSDGKTYTSGYNGSGMSISYFPNPKLSSVTANNDGIIIKWNKVSGAAQYRVYYKIGSGGWTKIADTASTSYTWKGGKSGTKYAFTVRCVSSDGKTHTSGYDVDGKSFKFIATPEISSVSAKSNGIVIKWGKVAGAEKYKVFRKMGNGSWISIGTTAYTNFTDIQANKGITYTYTVRCTDLKGNYTSGYDTKGLSAEAVSNPSNSSDMIEVAKKELGYTGGKKYWSWAGYTSRVPWCNIFVTWCADQLGYYESGRMPLIQWPKDSVVWFKDRGLFKNSSYIPKPGDLIYFVRYDETQPYHIGMVEKYENNTVYCIEGNSKDVVKRISYPHDSKKIYGYATPDYGHN